MSSITCTPAGAFRRNFKSAPCSDGRNLPESVKLFPETLIDSRFPMWFCAAACSMRPLYSAAAGAMGFGDEETALDSEGSTLFTRAVTGCVAGGASAGASEADPVEAGFSESAASETWGL